MSRELLPAIFIVLMTLVLVGLAVGIYHLTKSW
jgi:hypothetical protein